MPVTGAELFELILAVAAQEAVAAGYPRITTAHLLIALSRAGDAGTPTADPEAEAEIRREFEQLGIEPRLFRRRLRALLGTKGATPEGSKIRRSARCRAVFAAAETRASEEGVSMCVGHLVQAAMASLGEDNGSSGLDAHVADLGDDEIPDEL